MCNLALDIIVNTLYIKQIMENKKVMWIIILLITISVYKINADEPKILLQAILITNYPEYFFIEDEFGIIGNIYENINK
jgi:hypothetical protein